MVQIPVGPTKAADLTAQETRAAQEALVELYTSGSELKAGIKGHQELGANTLSEANRYTAAEAANYGKYVPGTTLPGPNFLLYGGAASKELKFHFGPPEVEHFEAVTAQTITDNIIYQQKTGLIKLRLPTTHIYIDPRNTQIGKTIQLY